MLTRSEEKCTATKDKSSSKNSDQKHSTIPRLDVVEVGEMVTMDHGGTIGGVDDDCQRMDYLQVAWLLREKLNNLVDGDKGEFPELGLRSLLDMAASRNIVSVDPKMLNPVLWRTLPKEMLHLVLARLPVPDIIRLRRLSREWRRDITTVNSDINQACDEARPIMVACISSKVWMSEGFLHLAFFVTICDLSTHKSQYSYCLHQIARNPSNPEWFDMVTSDGGLVCFVAWRPSKVNPLYILVVNFLTRDQHQLPPLQYVYLTPPQMLHLKVDSKTKCYKVVVIGKNIEGRPIVEIYDSSARQWTKTTTRLGFIFGNAYNWQYSSVHKVFRYTSRIRSVYDFVEGQFKSCDEKGPSQGALKTLRRKDCKFVLHKNTSNGESSTAERHCITMYRSQNNAKEWVQERSYLCSPFEGLLKKDSL